MNNKYSNYFLCAFIQVDIYGCLHLKFYKELLEHSKAEIFVKLCNEDTNIDIDTKVNADI